MRYACTQNSECYHLFLSIKPLAPSIISQSDFLIFLIYFRFLLPLLPILACLHNILCSRDSDCLDQVNLVVQPPLLHTDQEQNCRCIDTTI